MTPGFPLFALGASAGVTVIVEWVANRFVPLPLVAL